MQKQIDEIEELQRQIQDLSDEQQLIDQDQDDIIAMMSQGQELDQQIKSFDVKTYYNITFIKRLKILISQNCPSQQQLIQLLEQRKSKILKAIVQKKITFDKYIKQLCSIEPQGLGKYLSAKYLQDVNKQKQAYKKSSIKLQKMMGISIPKDQQQKNQSIKPQIVKKETKGQLIDKASYQNKVKFITQHFYKNINMIKFLKTNQKKKMVQQYYKQNKDYFELGEKLLKNLQVQNVSLKQFVDKYQKVAPSYNSFNELDKQELNQKIKTYLMIIQKSKNQIKRMHQKLMSRGTKYQQQIQLLQTKMSQAQQNKLYIKGLAKQKFVLFPNIGKKEINITKKKIVIDANVVKVRVTSKSQKSQGQYVLTLSNSHKEVKFALKYDVPFQQNFKLKSMEGLQKQKIKVIKPGKFLFFKTQDDKLVLDCAGFMDEQKIFVQNHNIQLEARINAPLGKSDKQRLYQYQVKKYQKFIPEQGYQFWILKQYPKLAAITNISQKSTKESVKKEQILSKPTIIKKQPIKEQPKPKPSNKLNKDQVKLPQYIPRKKRQKVLSGVQIKQWQQKQLRNPQLTCCAMSYLTYFEQHTDKYITGKGIQDNYNRRICQQINDQILSYKLKMENAIKNGSITMQKYKQIVNMSINKDRQLVKYLYKNEKYPEWQQFLSARLKMCLRQLKQ